MSDTLRSLSFLFNSLLSSAIYLSLTRVVIDLRLWPGGWLSINMSSCHYNKSHCGDMMILWQCSNGIFYTTMISLHQFKILLATYNQVFMSTSFQLSLTESWETILKVPKKHKIITAISMPECSLNADFSRLINIAIQNNNSVSTIL